MIMLARSLIGSGVFQFTLQAIRRTREAIEIGMTETKVGDILREEFAALGMPDGEGLVLFGGMFAASFRSLRTETQEPIQLCRKRGSAPRQRNGSCLDR